MEGGCPIISVQIGEPKGGNRPDKAAFSLRQSIVGKQRAQYRAISLASAPPPPPPPQKAVDKLTGTLVEHRFNPISRRHVL